MTARPRDPKGPDTAPADTAPLAGGGIISPAAKRPTVGRIVAYRLSQQDVADVNRRRRRSAAAPANDWGFVAPRGNPVKTGDVVAAVVTAVFGPATVNLRVLLDGTDDLWVTSRALIDSPGGWSWPERV